MSSIKKEVLALCIFLLLISLKAAYAQTDPVGCCINTAAGALACSAGPTERLSFRDKECCPSPETSPSYYKPQNPEGPADYNDCKNNFFFQQQGCSRVAACTTLGCCCSQSGGTIKSESQCRASGLAFHRGQTNCNQICPAPQCSNGIDDDNNGCADYPTDLGCTNNADNAESGGRCAAQGENCNNPNYSPRLSNLEIIPVNSQKKFSLRWQDECSQSSIYYEILRCKDSGCTNFATVGTAGTNSFEDSSGDLLFDTTYTYQIKSHYSLQTTVSSISKTANLGKIECLDKSTSTIFCLDNTPYSCDAANNLVPKGAKCSQNKVCSVSDNQPSCINKVNCNYNNANPFGLFYTLDGCEKENNRPRYCFYDRSHSTINSCFSCDSSMSCYDYKTEEACRRDNCRIGKCKWKSLASQIGIGVCVRTNEYNCQWCEKKGTSTLENIRAFNEIFDLCTKEKSNLLSERAFKCYFSETDSKSKNCGDITCKDYDGEQCSNAQIRHDENNKITNPSNDECGIKTCQKINELCVKNADGDDKADCDSSSTACESDYFAPSTSIISTIRNGVTDSLLIQIYDKTSIDSPAILKTSQNYVTFMCVEPCGSSGHPYNTKTTSRIIIISNLNAFDGDSADKVLSLNEGANIIRYYSQDSSKNLEEVKKITIEAHSNSDGPRVAKINITDGSSMLDKLFSSNQNPTINVEFFEPAIVTYARLVSKDSARILNLQGNTQLNARVRFSVTDTLPNGEYTFELNAKNSNNILMNSPFTKTIVIDNINPTLNINPPNGAIINSSPVKIDLIFNEEVTLETAKINLQDMKSSFSTTNNKNFTAQVNLPDGNKILEVAANDFAKNQVSGSSSFIVDANDTTIKLVSPRFGTASNYTFDIAVETDNNAVCRYSLDDNFEFDFMGPFTTTGGILHLISNFNGISFGNTNVHKLNIRCRDQRGQSFKSFDLNVDTTKPRLKSPFAFPNPVVERPSITTLTVEVDEPVVCRFSNNPQEFDNMRGKFEGFDENIFKIINRQNITLSSEGDFVYYVACMNKAELKSDSKEISFKVDLTIPLNIISHTPEFFNSTTAVLAIETNKRSQCKFSEIDPTVQNGEIFGVPGYSHTRRIESSIGKHTFFIICKDQYLEKFSDVKEIRFTVDTTPPLMLFVNDTSALANDYPALSEKTCLTDSLRVKWLGQDEESGVREHFYSIIKSDNEKIILNSTRNFMNNEWIIVKNLNLEDNAKYFFKVKAVNYAGMESEPKDSDGINVDTSLCAPNATNRTVVTCKARGDCKLDESCSDNSECESRFCVNSGSSGKCTQATCDDLIKNQDESAIDCGGPCSKCENDKSCNINNDCRSNFCSFGSCKLLEICSDGELSRGEADIDCGGPCPAKCQDGKSCIAIEDCGDNLECDKSICKKSAQPVPAVVDTDGDGMPDQWEIDNGLNPNDPSDAGLDSDKDGLTNLEEYNLQKIYGKSTNPNLADTDGDKFGDKAEVDKKTNPLDAKDFPKSNLAKILMFIFGIIILLSGFGYLAYRAVERRKEGISELPRQREAPIEISRQQIKQVSSKQKDEEIKIREALKRKEEQKFMERSKIFETFGKEEPKNIKIEKPELKDFKKEKLPLKKEAIQPKKDDFVKLRSIAKEAKQKKQDKKPKSNYKLGKLYELAKSKAKKAGK